MDELTQVKEQLIREMQFPFVLRVRLYCVDINLERDQPAGWCRGPDKAKSQISPGLGFARYVMGWGEGIARESPV